MLKNITLENFKCFRKKTSLPLSQITIMYGKNGRGKSTAAQSLLLMAQTLVGGKDIRNLQLTGKYVALGTFEDVVNKYAEDKHSFGISLRYDREVVEMSFEPMQDKPQMAQIAKLNVNGESRFEESDTLDKSSESGKRHLGVTSDIESLQMLKNVRYISAGRVGPQNSISRRDDLDDDELGVDGKHVINVLSRKGVDFTKMVGEKLSYILGGAAIKVSSNDPERIELYLNSKDGKDTYKPVNVGFGYSYVLPVIVAAFLAKEGSILIIENPEAHLHPAAQSRIMEFLIDIAKEKKLQLIIETHSDHVVNGMRIAIKKRKLKVGEACVLYFSDDNPPVHISCNRKGSLSEYPNDFLDEWTLQMLELVK